MLVKGFDYDHAVIFDTDALDAKDVYFTMIRILKSLTIIETNRQLSPK